MAIMRRRQYEAVFRARAAQNAQNTEQKTKTMDSELGKSIRIN
jgi:hypothetical protein